METEEDCLRNAAGLFRPLRPGGTAPGLPDFSAAAGGPQREVKAAGDQRAKAVCPLLKQGIRGMDPAFIDAVKEAGRILAEDPEQRRFMERLTEEQDELKTLREKLGGF